MNNFRTTVLLVGLTGLLLVLGSIFGGTRGMTVMFVVAILMSVISYWCSDKMVLSMYGARKISSKDAPELMRIVSTLAQKGKIPTPDIYMIETDVPNAFATGRNPKNAAVAITTGLVAVCNTDELEGVLAHELAHIKNRDTLVATVVATLAGIITMLGYLAHWLLFWGRTRSGIQAKSLRGMLEMVCFALLAPMAAILIRLGISRSREYLADETGAQLSGEPAALANALHKIDLYAKQKILPEAMPSTSHMFIVSPFNHTAGSWLTAMFNTHPVTEERVRRLRTMERA